MENMSFDDPDAAFDEVAFRDDESTRKYIDTAISRNIQHTLKMTITVNISINCGNFTKKVS